MEDQDLVTVIIPTYNRVNLISSAIESVLNQTYKNWEIIIVDDGSTDNTKEIIQPYLIDARIKYFFINNSGACVARNYGIDLSNGSYLSFLDSDDEYYPRKIELQVEVFKNSKILNLGVVSCGRHDFRDNQLYFEWVPKYSGNILKQLLSKKRIGAGTPFLMISRAVKNLGIRFDPNMPAAQDFDFLVQICQKFNFDFVPIPLVKVNHHTGDRVYNGARAIKACELQFEKFKELISSDKKVHESFILKQCDLNFTYQRRDEALKILKENFSIISFKKYLWLPYFTVFRAVNSSISRICLKFLRMISF